MPQKISASIRDHFVELTDPRRRKVTYPLINIVTIAICAVICGADDSVSIAHEGEADLPEIWAEPLAAVIRTLTENDTVEEVARNFPDVELLRLPGQRKD